MRKLFFALILQLFCVGVFSETVSIIGDANPPKGSTRTYIARTSAYDPNYLYNWSINGGTMTIYNYSEIDVKWGNGDFGSVSVHCIVQYTPSRTCDASITFRLTDGVATVITTSPFGELCLTETNVLERYIPSCVNTRF